MSRTLKNTDALRGIISYSQRLETPLTGLAYLNSRQKRELDKYGAHLLALVASPLVAAARFAVWSHDGGPTLIAVPRLGKDGDEFGEYKIRSMMQGSENAVPTSLMKLTSDPRVTSVGKIIRNLSVDELPQLENVKAGAMSLVGPRPKSAQQVQSFDEYASGFYDAYTSTRPGITGLEQIYGRGVATPDQMIAFTMQYTAEASLALDMHVLKKTIGAVASRRGAY